MFLLYMLCGVEQIFRESRACRGLVLWGLLGLVILGKVCDGVDECEECGFVFVDAPCVVLVIVFEVEFEVVCMFTDDGAVDAGEFFNGFGVVGEDEHVFRLSCLLLCFYYTCCAG